MLMKQHDIAKLQDEDNWDWQHGEVRLGSRGKASVVVAVVFSEADFQRVSQQAERLGKSTPSFVRDATLEAIGPLASPTSEAAG